MDAALAAGTDVVLRIDVQGAATVKRLIPDCVSIFITADSEDVLVKRLAARKTEPLVRAGWACGAVPHFKGSRQP